jgi:hypothetical protein
VTRPDAATIPIPPPDPVAVGVRILEARDRDDATWATLPAEAQDAAQALHWRSRGRCIDCGAHALSADARCLRHAIADAG